MCVELFVDKLLVYTSCKTPSPSTIQAPHAMNAPSTLNTTLNTTLDMYKSASNYSIPDNTLTYVLISAVASIPCIIWCVIALCRRKKKTQPRRLAKKKQCCKCTKDKKLPVRQPKGTQTRKNIKDSS